VTLGHVPESAEFPVRAEGQVPFVSSRLLDGNDCLRHWFCGRIGGEGSGPYAGLNLSSRVGDDPDTVERNHGTLARSLRLPRPPLVLKQVHGNRVVVAGPGNVDQLTANPPEADSVITAVKNVPLAILTADCVPVVICDVRTPALAVAHAGWRGTVRSVVWKTILTMFDEYGTDPADCYAVIGPSIEPKCYQIGEDVREVFIKGLPYGADVLERSDDIHWTADLKEANRRQILDARLSPSRIAVCPFCTRCEADWFFSARRDGEMSGRHGTVAMLVG